jgi:hypothetical protein
MSTNFVMQVKEAIKAGDRDALYILFAMAGRSWKKRQPSCGGCTSSKCGQCTHAPRDFRKASEVAEAWLESQSQQP